MAPPSASSSSTNSSAPYKLPAAPLIARNLSTLLSNGASSSTSGSSWTLPIEALRDLLTSSRPPLVGDATTNQVQAEAEEDSLPVIDPHELLSSNRSLEEHLQSPKERADLLDLAQGLALALARPQDGDSVAAGVTGNAASSLASAILSLVESRLLLAACYVVLALLPAAPAEATTSKQAGSGKTDPAARLAQAATQLDVARDELREAQRRHNSSLKERRRNDSSTPGEPTAIDDDDAHLLRQLASSQARLLLASANVAHLSGRPEHEVKRLLGWWVKATGQAQAQMGKGKGSGSGAEGTRGDKAGGAVAG